MTKLITRMLVLCSSGVLAEFWVDLPRLGVTSLRVVELTVVGNVAGFIVSFTQPMQEEIDLNNILLEFPHDRIMTWIVQL